MSICPFANQSHRFDSHYGGSYTGGPYKGVLHTTECAGLPSYGGGSEAPHFTVVPNTKTKTVAIYQHYDTKRPARALLNPGGGVQTNNDGAIQIELAGTCDPDYRHGGKGIFWPEAPSWALDALASLMRWIEGEHEIPRQKSKRPWLPYPDSYGDRNGGRMGGHEWDNFAGWCGHSQVAENWHGDPGDLDIDYLLAWNPTRVIVTKGKTTLGALAAALGIALVALIGLNPGVTHDPAAPIQPGTTITVPPTQAPVQPPSRSKDPAKKPNVTKQPADSVDSSHPTLRQGATGTAVKRVQSLVGVKADGDFGPATRDAVKAFQRKHGLGADGIVGPATWAALDKAQRPAAKAPANDHPTLRQGSTGAAVSRVQSLVGVKADGDFGPNTAAAVRAFQRRNGLGADGIVGSRTWARLNGASRPAVSRPTLRVGSTDRNVRTVQRAVGARVDGIFGSGTAAKVRSFQRKHHLAADGIVGPATWRAMGV